MIWTETTPTKEGWYWHKQFNGKRYLEPEIIKIISIGTHDRFLVEVSDRQWDLALVSKECLWAGPIEEPND
jgi:hypothetical protein